MGQFGRVMESAKVGVPCPCFFPALSGCNDERINWNASLGVR